MPVCSYVIHPVEGQGTPTKTFLSSLEHCTVYPADNHDLLVLVTEAPDPPTDKALRETISQYAGVACMSLAFAHTGEDLAHA